MPPPIINRNHDKTQELLSADIDNETDSVQKLEIDTHMGHCDTCRELYEKFQYLSQFTRSWPDESISADLDQKVRNNFDGIKIHIGKEPVTKESFTARLVVILFIVVVIFLVSSDISKNIAEEKKQAERRKQKLLEEGDTKSPVVNITIVSPGGNGKTTSQENSQEDYQISYDKNSNVKINLGSASSSQKLTVSSEEFSSANRSNQNPNNIQNNETNQKNNSYNNQSAQNLSEQFQYDNSDKKQEIQNSFNNESLTKENNQTESSNDSNETMTTPSQNYQIARRQIDQKDFQKRSSEIRNLSEEEYKALYANQSIKQSQLLQELTPAQDKKKADVSIKPIEPEIIHDYEFNFQFNDTQETPDTLFPTAYNNDLVRKIIDKLSNNQLPEKSEIHIGQIINSFKYPFVFTPDVTHTDPVLYKTHIMPCVWNTNHSLLAIELSPQYNPNQDLYLDIIQAQITFNSQVIKSYKMLGLVNSSQNINSAFNKFKKPILMLFEIDFSNSLSWEKLPEIDFFTLRFKYFNESEQQPASWTKAFFKSEIETNITIPLVGISALAEFALVLADSPQRGTANYDHVINILESIDWPEETQRKGLISIISKAKSIDYRIYNKSENLFSNDF